MYIYKDGKLYFQKNEKIMVGVEISPSKITMVDGTETKVTGKFLYLTNYEIMKKFHITEETPYIFPDVPAKVKETVKPKAKAKAKTTKK